MNAITDVYDSFTFKDLINEEKKGRIAVSADYAI